MNEHDIPLSDAIDHEILMHKDTHFGGSFIAMLAYYQKEGRGIRPEFHIERIEHLKALDEECGGKLSEKVLFEQEKEDVAHAKQKYAELRDLYESEGNALPRMIADLILSEEEEPSKEIAAIIGQGNKAVQPLLTLLSSEDFYNPLYPGYGEAPALAAKCLGLIGDERAIQPLFNALGREDFFTEEAVLDALAVIGDRAKEFLLNVLKKMPFSKDNERALIALLCFKEDPQIAKVCFQLLQDLQNVSHATFAAYLVMGCYALREPQDREAFVQLAKQSALPPQLRGEVDILIHQWKKHPS